MFTVFGAKNRQFKVDRDEVMEVVKKVWRDEWL